ncbi:MAG: LptF/LptG family permease [Bdellovibrionaceae bacterium]|nr:LptF/LptG family permease [Pseudobdellovibrionaceae bacterium]
MLSFLQSSKLEFFCYIFNKLIKKFLFITFLFCCIFYILEVLKLFSYFSSRITFLDFITYLAIDLFTFLPLLLPISLLIAILFVYNSLFFNNEFLLSSMLGLKFFFYPIAAAGFFVFLLSLQVNFFLKPMASYKLKIMRNQFSVSVYQSMKSEVFQLGIKDSLFYAKDKLSNNFFKNIFAFIPNKKNNISMYAKKSRTFIKTEEDKKDLILELHKGKAYNFSEKEPFLYNFDKAQFLLQSFATNSIKPHLKYYNLLDLNSSNSFDNQIAQKQVIYKYKSINLILSCLSFCLLAWILLPMNFSKKKWQSATAVFVVSIFWLLYSIFLSLSKKSFGTEYLIYLMPNLWIIIFCFWMYYKRKRNIPLSERMLSF